METLTKKQLQTKTLIQNYINSQSYQEEFKDIMLNMLDTYGVEMFNISGIGEQLDINSAVKQLVNASSTAGGTIDGNANVGGVTAGGLLQEINKPHLLIQSYYRIWKWLKKNRGLDVANTFIEKQINGAIYMNDMHYIVGCISYCYNHSVLTIINQGLIGIDEKGDALPPKHLRSYFDQIEAYLLIAGSNTAGATGIAGLMLGASIFMDKILKTGKDSGVPIGDPWRYLKEELTSLIYRLNQPSRHLQSLFTNVSIFDDYFLDTVIPEYFAIIDDEVYQPSKELVKKVQQVYLDVINEESKRRVLTFPVTTACFSIKRDENTGKTELRDHAFLKQIAEANLETAYINIYAGETSTLSSCCFDGNQEVLIRSSNGVELLPFKDVKFTDDDGGKRKNLTVYHNGSWLRGKLVKTEYNDKMYKVVTANNKVLNMTKDHISVTLDGDKTSEQLTSEDYIAFNTRGLNSWNTKAKGLTYNQGFLLGAYLGDGSKYKEKHCESYTITFTCGEKKLYIIDILSQALKDWGIDSNITTSQDKHNCWFISINSKKLYDIINEYIYGSYCYDKSINMNVLDESLDFRRGIYEGLYATDGGNSNRIYTTSKQLAKDLEALFTSLGINTIIDISDRTNEPVVIRGEVYTRNYPLYCVRWYKPANGRGLANIYKIHNNTEYFKVKSIEEYDYSGTVYCFEMVNHEPYFTLPNGILTHNCRLQSDKSNKFFNSLGGASDAIGSFGVVSVNLPRIAYKHKGDIEGFMQELEDTSYLAQECNYAKRCLLKSTIAKGHAPLYTNGYMDLKNQFSTLGFVGLYEACEILGYDITKYDGMEIGKDILGKMKEVTENVQEKYKIACNLEGVPAEGLAPKFAKKDRVLELNTEYKLYANQFIPLHKRCNMLNRIQLQAEYDKYCSGGSILHLNVDQKIDLPTMENLIEAVIQSGTRYFALNYNIYQCNKCRGITVGTTSTCSHCGSTDIERYLRVVGFITKVKDWVPARIEEDRQFYKV